MAAPFPVSIEREPSASSGPRVFADRYVVVGVLGRGVMGDVYRVYDTFIGREVALKVLRTRRSEAQERLVVEARAMAKLSHPNVVTVYDVQMLDGQVLLSMQCVEGQTLKAWLRSQPRTCNEILGIFRQAARGLLAAHEAGIVHRDFKPENVLVTHDARALVADFGIAAPWHEETDADATGRDASMPPRRPMGTPWYMAPEQHFGITVDPRIDQYAFCVSLWEALAGAPIFGNVDDPALLLTRKHEPLPPWPADVDAPEEAVRAIYRGLSLNAEDRFPTMAELLASLTSDDPSVRWLRRLALGSMVIVVGMAGIAGKAWLDARGQRCSGGDAQIAALWSDSRREDIEHAMLATRLPYAATTWRSVARRVDGFASAWSTTHREACEATTVEGKQPAALLDLRMACLQRAKIQLAAVLDVLEAADARTVEKAQHVVDGLPSLARCSDIEALRAEVSPPDPDDEAAVEAMRRQLAQARALQKAGKTSEAKALIEPLLLEGDAVGYAPIQTQISLLAGLVHSQLGQLVEARAAFADALVRALRLRQRAEAYEAAGSLVTTAGWAQGRLGEAWAYVPVALALAPKDGPEAALVHNHLGTLYERQGSAVEAEREYRMALALLENAPDQPLTRLGIAGNLAQLHSWRGRPELAEPEQRRILAERQQLLGATHPDTILSQLYLGFTLTTLGHDEAESLLRDALRHAEATLPSEHPIIGYSLHYLVQLLVAKHRHAEARPLLNRAIALWEKQPLRIELPTSHADLGRVAAGEGRHVEADAQYRIALAQFIELFGPECGPVHELRVDIGRTLHALGRHDEALEQLRAALSGWDENDEAEAVNVALIRSELGRVLAAVGRPREADAMLAAAEALFESRLGADHPDVVELRKRRHSLRSSAIASR